MPGSWFSARSLPLAGLTWAPQAQAPSLGPVPAPLAVPRLSRLIAALTSRSRTRPHAWQQKTRSLSVRLGFRHPHPEHVLLEGYQRSAVISWPPFHVVL